ncbi:MAG: hypothetical protein ACYTGN_06985 [Planctomycetota bacterium]
MRSVALVVLLLLLANCGDPGPRDRSLKVESNRELLTLLRRVKAKRATPGGQSASPSIIGLVSDPLAPFYPENAALVIRFDALATLDRDAGPQFAEVRQTLPELGLPAGTAEVLLRRVTGTDKSIVFDPLRPFAFIKLEQGWLAIAAARPGETAVDPEAIEKDNGTRLRPLDGVYAAIGSAAAVDAFKPASRTGFYLPGHCSVVATPEAAAHIGAELGSLAKPLGIDLAFIDGVLPDLPEDLARVDLSIRFDRSGMRVDARLAPQRESATALLLSRLRPATPVALDWLPRDGTFYVEMGIPALEWEGLGAHLAGAEVTIPEELDQPVLHSVRKGLSLLDKDAAALLDLDPDGTGRLFFVASLRKPEAARSFIGSPDFFRLLTAIAGPDGHLEFTPGVISEGDTAVGTITGHLSRKRLAQWRKEGLLNSSASMMLRGPIAAYVAVADDKLCLLVAKQERSETKRFVEMLKKRSQPGGAHATTADSLLHKRLASFSVDLAALYDGCRKSAPFWHEHGDALRELTLRWRLPVSGAIGIEGGALRIALRLPPDRLADAAARVLSRLRESAAEAAAEKTEGK